LLAKTVFFCDIVGYTTLSSELPASKVANMLDRLYAQFDALASLHQVDPLETIGDCYIAATNLHTKQPESHAARMAAFSIGVLQAARRTLIDTEDTSRGCVHVRVGFHSGPLVADVVGKRNPKFCILGDTVNTASRMESTSVSGRIQCSERSAALIRQQSRDISLQPRGVIAIKGKGEMETVWILEKLTSLPEGAAEPLEEGVDVATTDLVIGVAASTTEQGAPEEAPYADSGCDATDNLH
jgi:class 3 adenylate cyclase